MEFINKVKNWIKGLKTEETEVVTKDNEEETPKDTEELELRLMRQLYKTNKKQDELLTYKSQLESANFENQHSCKFCKFCREKVGRYTIGKEYLCLVKEKCVAFYDIHNPDSTRESMRKYRENNKCTYFRKIESYRGYSIEEIMNAQERDENELCV